MAERSGSHPRVWAIGLTLGFLALAAVIGTAFAGEALTLDTLPPSQREPPLVEAGVSILPGDVDSAVAFRGHNCETLNLDPDCVTPAKTARDLTNSFSPTKQIP